MCMHLNAVLDLPLCMRQPCVHAQLCFATSVPSSQGVALNMHLAAPDSLCTEQPCVGILQSFASSTHFWGEAATHTHATAPCYFGTFSRWVLPSYRISRISILRIPPLLSFFMVHCFIVYLLSL